MYIFRLFFRIAIIALAPFVSLQPLSAQAHHWNSHAEVAKKVKDKFAEMETYSAAFRILTEDGRRTRTMNGTLYFKKGGKIRFDFSSPQGDFILSDGKILWIFIRRLNAVGKQDLTLETKDENHQAVFLGAPGPGLNRLFTKYHYRFDGVEQPRSVDGCDCFVMDLNQRVKIGGFESIKLFIDSQSYLIKKAVGTDSLGKKTTVEFSGQKENPPLEGKLFQFSPGDNVRVVHNPLVSE